MEEKTNNIIVYILLGLFIILFFGLFGYGIYMNDSKKSSSSKSETTTTKRVVVDEDKEIAVFHGGAGEITYQTYIYKKDNGHANYGFEYRNETCMTKSWGSSEWVCNTTDSGSFTWTDEAFDIAKDNYAYSYVTIPDKEGTYSINEFADMFMMD